MPSLQVKPDQLKNNIQKTAADYMKSILKDISSIKLISPEEIENNPDKYPQGTGYTKQTFLLIKSEQEYSHMNLQEFYDELPRSLLKFLEIHPYKNPDSTGLIIELNIRATTMDPFNQSMELSDTDRDDFGLLLDSIKENIEYITNKNELVTINTVTSTSANIIVHKSQFPYITKHGSPDYTTIAPFINSEFQCNKIIRLNNSYYQLSLKPIQPNQAHKFLFHDCHTDKLALRCTTCKNNTVTISDNYHIVYCTSCNDTYSAIDLYEVPKTISLSDLTEKWTQYTTDDIPDSIPQKKQEITHTNNGKSIYLKNGQVSASVKSLYTELDNGFSFPFDIITKELQVQYQKDHPKHTCYMCSKQNEEETYLYIQGVEIPLNDTNKILEDILICKNCKQELTQEFHNIIKKAPDLNQKLVSQSI